MGPSAQPAQGCSRAAGGGARSGRGLGRRSLRSRPYRSELSSENMSLLVGGAAGRHESAGRKHTVTALRRQPPHATLLNSVRKARSQNQRKASSRLRYASAVRAWDIISHGAIAHRQGRLNRVILHRSSYEEGTSGTKQRAKANSENNPNCEASATGLNHQASAKPRTSAVDFRSQQRWNGHRQVEQADPGRKGMDEKNYEMAHQEW